MFSGQHGWWKKISTQNYRRTIPIIHGLDVWSIWQVPAIRRSPQIAFKGGRRHIPPSQCYFRLRNPHTSTILTCVKQKKFPIYIASQVTMGIAKRLKELCSCNHHGSVSDVSRRWDRVLNCPGPGVVGSASSLMVSSSGPFHFPFTLGDESSAGAVPLSALSKAGGNGQDRSARR